MDWRTIQRPGYAGNNRDERIAEYNKKYGKGNWRIAWHWNCTVIDRTLALQLYEDGYYADSFRRPDVWTELIDTAREVYDIEETDVESGLDYTIQNAIATHLQDISVRRVLKRR